MKTQVSQMSKKKSIMGGTSIFTIPKQSQHSSQEDRLKEASQLLKGQQPSFHFANFKLMPEDHPDSRLRGLATVSPGANEMDDWNQLKFARLFQP
jgi:hypothetical protein